MFSPAPMGHAQAMVWILLTAQVVIVASSNLRTRGGVEGQEKSAAPPCHEVREVADERHDLGIAKGHLLADVYSQCEMKYKESKNLADTVLVKAGLKIVDAKHSVAELEQKIASASAGDNDIHPATGTSRKMNWEDTLDEKQGEQVFYKQIVENAKEVLSLTETGMSDTSVLRTKIQGEFEQLEKMQLPYETQADHAEEVLEKAKKLWEQWLASSKDYNCGNPAAVQNAVSTCEKGNTKFSRKCPITCATGYDDPKDSKNTLRCQKEGKFGKELYGEWIGMAACVGRMCGEPSQIAKAKTVVQKIRFPHVAHYNCYEGYSTTSAAKGPKTFTVPCGDTGHFLNNASHVCKRIKCGAAAVWKGTQPVAGTFYFGDTLSYRCKPGHTLDATPGGIRNYTTSCQATGRATQGHPCKRVRCGPAPSYENTALLSTKGEKYFADELKYECNAGYSTDQRVEGPKKYTLRCAADGEFAVKGVASDEPIPQCRAVSAGVLPAVAHGNAKRREMFFGESVLITADIGYSTSAKPMEGLSFIVAVTPQGKFDGLQRFRPVSCMAPPTIKKATTSFDRKEAEYGDAVTYECAEGYSTDRTAAKATKSFVLQCEADADFSRVPNLGFCANIDDCAEHTCGPHGDCVDKLNNYTCSCSAGFEQTWNDETKELICGNIDDCGPEACGVGTCKDELEGFSCLCPSGYKEIGELDSKTCQAKVCGNPPRVENSATMPVEVAFEKASYQDKVLYKCDEGYTLDATPVGKNHFSIDCLANEKFTETKSCKAIDCGEGPTVSFASSSPASATFNDTIRFTCEDGYTIDGTPNGDGGFGLTCQVTGEYGEASKCRPVNCGEPDEVPSSSRPDGSLEYTQSVTYKCFQGFTLDGKRDGPTEYNVKCNADGSLDKLQSCLPKVCGEPAKHINALYATTADEGEVAYPRQTEISCRDGFTVDGSAGGNISFTVQCMDTGLFDEYDKKQCAPVRCGAPPDMANATLRNIDSPHKHEEGHLNYEEKAFYKCDPGFSIGGEMGAPTTFKVECLPNGELSAPAPDMQCRNVNDCEGHTCGAKGTCVDLVGPAPAYTCDCDFGFDLRTKPNGEKHCGNTDNCKDQDCGVGVCKDLIGDYTCICPAGHYIAEQDGKKTCVPVRCSDETPTLDHGRLLSNHEGAVDFPATLQYKCDQGYSIDGTVAESKRKFQGQCKSNGELDGMMACQKISCGAPRVLPFADLLAPWTPRKSVEYDEVVPYTCLEGHTIGGHAEFDSEFSVTCPDSGVLTDPKVCEPVKCGRAPSVSKARAAVAGDVFFGMHLEYNCDAGHTLNGLAGGATEFQRHCLTDATFSPLPDDESPCKPVSGGRAPTVENAVMTEYAGRPVENFPPEIYYPNGLEYKCNAGFTENGAAGGPTKLSSKVNSIGQLAPALSAKCLPITYTVRGQVKDARNGRSLAGVTVQVSGGQRKSTSIWKPFFRLAGITGGNLTLTYKKDGYIEVVKTLSVNGNINLGGVADISLSPVMKSDEWRAVVKWGHEPADLDTYAQWGSSKVCWYDTTRRSMGMTGVLEHDDTDSWGPETLYLTGVGKCQASSRYCDIKYTINDYDEGYYGVMKDISDAQVTLYHGESVAGSWKIGDCQRTVSGDGNWWHVFTIDGKTNEVKWNCNMGPENNEALNLFHDHYNKKSHIKAPVANMTPFNSTLPTISIAADLKPRVTPQHISAELQPRAAPEHKSEARLVSSSFAAPSQLRASPKKFLL